ncbi:MAG: outer membrane protein assembly factor BamE [Bdellovibrionales bacterium]
MKYLLFIFLFLNLACSTTPFKRFEKVKVGMYKDDVLDIAGSPQESNFKNDEYVWYYRFITDAGTLVREVRLKQDFVSYVGDPLGTSGEKFSKVRVGMTKAQILDLVGFPGRAETVNGLDIWTYTVNTPKEKKTMSIEFAQDKATYAGPPKEKSEAPTGDFVPVE